MNTSEMNEDFDFSKTCRLCLNQNNELISIFDNSSFEIQYSKMISECTGVMITQNDELPKKVCLECMECSNKCYQFRKLVLNSEHRLYKFLNKDVKIENIKEENLSINSDEEDTYDMEHDSELDIKIETTDLKAEICETETATEPTSIINQKRDVQPIFTCQSCSKTFAQKRYLKSHEKIHKKTNENNSKKSYICKQCGKSFTCSSTLKHHERSHTGVKSYTCNLCGKSFTYLSTLREHIRIHTGEKPYSCDQCGKWFTQSSQLKKHERFHKGEKPYVCKYCDKAFSVKFVLKNHELTHSGAKPFKCDSCGKSFAQLANLKRHENIHPRKKPFSCKQCKKSFNQLDSLKKHEKRHKVHRKISESESSE